METNDITILVAEDDESNYLLIKSILGREYNLLHAWNGEEAVGLFISDKPELILMDIKMPVVDGYEATKRIREISESIPIIAVTAYAFEEDEARIMGFGFSGYMSKPINRIKLKEMIAEMLSAKK